MCTQASSSQPRPRTVPRTRDNKGALYEAAPGDIWAGLAIKLLVCGRGTEPGTVRYETGTNEVRY